MLKTLILGVSATLLLACISAPIQMPEPPPTALEMICAETQWEGCSNLPEPIVVRSKVVPPIYYGFYYDKEPYIFVSPRLSPEQARHTELHETVHYVISMLDHPLRKDRCGNEEMARKLTALILNEPYDDSWRKIYGCTRSYMIRWGTL